ncbi:ATP-grasp domain-containing protein [Streptomyces sp. AJS327]|uniref:ATP-grasp domain-containing protein n=1 Tax=Streptomyces sp. AJS327 TaxID=2545265 RepID=UPI0015DF851B|nr:ATP-grasp domain-containing protein [Streptomyces sp. AJS327]MBA0051703.1 ATP-grasp domain-containing protein [Streptomyces sp. AJS327]
MKNAFVLLELLNHMVLVAQEAKARGYHVVALNHDPLRDSGPFAVPDGVVDEVIPVESWADEEQLGKILDDVLGRYQVAGTYTAFEAALPAEAVLRERAGLPGNGPETTSTALDKIEVRRILRENGLSGLGSASLTEALEWTEWPFAGGAILKPANGTGSALCFRVSSLEELREAVERTRSVEVVNPLMREYVERHGGFVLEEEATGELLSVECLVDRGEVHVLGLMGRYVLASDPVVEAGTRFPYDHPRTPEIIERVTAFHRCLGVRHGPTHIEVMVVEDGPVELIDFNLRSAGVATVVCFSEAFGTRHEEVLTDLACGVTPDLGFLGGPIRYTAEMLVLPPPNSTLMESLEFPEGSFCQRLMRPLGKPLSGRSDQLDVVCMFNVSADTAAEVHTKVLEARRATVFNGEPLGDNPNNDLAFSPYLARDMPRLH